MLLKLSPVPHLYRRPSPNFSCSNDCVDCYRSIRNLGPRIERFFGMRKESIVLRTGEEISIKAIDFATSRGGGPGGQNVNKVETRVEARLDLRERPELSETTLQTLQHRLRNKLDTRGTLRVVSSTERSQLGNRLAAIKRLEETLNEALKPKKPRVKTKPSRGSKGEEIEEEKGYGGEEGETAVERGWLVGSRKMSRRLGLSRLCFFLLILSIFKELTLSPATNNPPLIHY